MGFESQAYSRVTEAPIDFAALALRTVLLRGALSKLIKLVV